MTEWAGPLGKLQVLDFTRVLAGPYATLILGDLGAKIIKIEAPGKGDDTRGFPPFHNDLSHYYTAMNRNKASLAIDLRQAEGRDIALRLAEQSDVLVENFRPGVMDRLGLGYQQIAARNPRIVYCSISGFGMEGPLSDKPSFDIVTQALSGAMSVNGEPGGGPAKLGLPLGDMVGGINGSIAILAALTERSETGRGRHIDISLLDGLIGMLGYLAQLYFVTGKSPQPVGTRHPNLVPYGSFQTADGHVIVACLTEDFWKNLARAIGRAELIEDARFASYDSRLKNRDALDAEVAGEMVKRTTQEWVRILEEGDVPHAPILSVEQALQHPNTIARGMVTKVQHPELGEFNMLGRPIKFPGSPQSDLKPPSQLGADTRAVLREQLGLSDADLDALYQHKVLA